MLRLVLEQLVKLLSHFFELKKKHVIVCMKENAVKHRAGVTLFNNHLKALTEILYQRSFQDIRQHELSLR